MVSKWDNVWIFYLICKVSNPQYIKVSHLKIMGILCYFLKISLTSFNTFKSIPWSDYINIYCNNIFIIIIFVYVHLYICTCDCIYDTESMWKSEDYLRELILSFYSVGSGVQTQAFILFIYTLIHLATSPVY